MATLYLARHGQASFGAADYDQLSALGERQGHALGRWFAKAVGSVDHLVAGSLKRHQQTAQAAMLTWSAAGFALPALATDPRLNEYDHVDFLQVAQRELGSDFQLRPDLTRAQFHQLFEIAFKRWLDDRHASQYAEPFGAFRHRVISGLEALLSSSAQTTVAFSSGGSIAVMVQALMGLDIERTMNVNTLMANGAITKIVYSGSRRSVAYVNSYGFLEGQSSELVSFR
jgi:broad specificity phosphatase PhoE